MISIIHIKNKIIYIRTSVEDHSVVSVRFVKSVTRKDKYVDINCLLHMLNFLIIITTNKRKF